MDYTILKVDLLDYLKLNPSAEAPYHNNDHMSIMTDIAAAIYLKECGKVDKHDLTVVIVAGMLHDWGHSAGQFADNVNIARAVAGFQGYMAWQGSGFTINNIRGSFEDDVTKAIVCTEFPFVHEPTTLVEKALRDADILYASMSQDPELILTELRKEIEVSQKRNISRVDMCAGQKAFFASAVLYTRTGQELWDNHAPKFIKKMEKALKA